MGEVYDQPRETLTPEQVDREPALPDHGGRRSHPLDPVVRLRARARLAAQHAGLDDQQEALLGAGAADLRLRRLWHGLGRRRARGAARTSHRWLAGVRGPHAPPSLHRRRAYRLHRLWRAGLAHPRRRQPLARCRHRALQHPPLPRGSRLLGALVPGRFHHRELPRAVPQLVLLDARHEHGPPARATLQDHLRLCPRLRRGRAPDEQERGQRHRVRRGRRSDGRRRHALDVRQGAAGGQHPLRLACRGRGATRAAGPLERLRLLRDLRPPRWLASRRCAGAARRRAPCARPLAADAGSRRGGRGRPEAGRLRCRRRGPRPVELRRRPLDLVSASQPAAVLADRDAHRAQRRVRDAAHGPGGDQRPAGAHPAVPRGVDVRQPDLGAARRDRFGPSHGVADGPPQRGSRREPGDVDGHRSPRGRAHAHPAVECQAPLTTAARGGLAGGPRPMRRP